jgi:opacity protein-like surface antigen
MKKLVLSFLFIILFSVAHAQAVLGVKAGPAISRFYVLVGDSAAGFSNPHLAYLVGGFMRFNMSEKISLQTELLYSSKGSSNTQYGYIALPFMIQYEFLPNLRAEVGVEGDYLLSAQIESTSGNRRDARFQFKKWDVGLNLGISYDFSKNFTAGLRYNLGLINTWDTEPRFGVAPDLDYRNHNLQLSFGYLFR